MAFIGNTNTTQAFTPAIDTFSGNGSTVAFTLSRPVASVAQVQVNISNVPQNPSDAYTVSGNTITFTSAPLSGTNNIYVYYTSPITQVITPGQSTVGTTQIQNGVTINFADGSAAAPSITNDGDTNTGIFFPAADTIAFTEGGVEIARFDSSGNLGIGTSSPSARLTVSDTNAIPLRLGDVSSAPTSQTACYVGTATTGLSGAGNGDLVVIPRTSTTGSILFWTGNGTAAERVRIDSSGNVGIGTTTPQSTFQVGSVNAGTSESTNKGLVMIQSSPATVDSAGGLEFKTSSSGSGYGWKIGGLNTTNDPFVIGNRSNSATFTERMRIDSSGNLLVGGTSNGGAILHAERSTSAVVGRFYNSMSSGFTSDLLQAIAVQGSSTGCTLLGVYYSGGATFAFRVRGDGTIYAQNTTVQSASDARFKENIVDSSDGLNVISALRPVRFDLKEGNGVSAKTNQLGFIAQEVKPVFPDAVDVWKESDDPENPYLSMGTTALIPVLTKAIQEQQALIQSLTDRITALENI